MDIRPPKRRPVVPQPQPQRREQQLPQPKTAMPESSFDVESPTPPARRSFRKKALIVVGSILLVLAAACMAMYMAYQSQLQPVDTASKEHIRITIVSGSSPSQIGEQLYEQKLIHSTRAFDIYTRLTKTRNKLQAGSYSLSPTQSLGKIVEHLVSGKADQFKVTFFTGGALKATPGTADDKKTDVESMLLRAGYAQSEIDEALAATYDSPLFAGKPANTSLEGYVYGDTYVIDSSTSLKQLLALTFTTFNDAISKADIMTGLSEQGLTLYEGITLASIVQAEMGAHEADMPQVAQVFLKRLGAGTPLGSDVTAYYGADKIGAKRSVAVDTPYNTRIHAGLPPGPIGAPGIAALKAVARPASGDYSFFLSGDDGTTHFATTDAQHEANKVYCRQLCSIP